MKSPRSAPATPGCVDFIAYCAALDGWVAGGSIAQGWQEAETADAVLDFGMTRTEGAATICLYAREDAGENGAGFVLFVAGGGEFAQRDLTDLWLRSERQVFNLKPSAQLQRPSDAVALSRGRSLLAGAPATERRARLLKMLNRAAFTGVDTLHLLKSPVRLEVDVAAFCPPAGVLLHGWFADPFGQVASIRLRGPHGAVTLDPASWVATPRADVAALFADTHPDMKVECGYMAYVPDILSAGETPYLEVELHDGETGYKCLPDLHSPGLRTIRTVLSRFELRHQDMVRAYDEVIGPAVSAINAALRAQPASVREMVFGDQPVRPGCAIVVPLHGRIDFMEYQLAAFAGTLDARHELIYVLDDPPLRREAETLAAACFARFGQPFRLLTLRENIGFGPACNVGLAHVRAQHTCFLNSDVFPKRGGWLEDMLATQKSDKRIGAVGALLLYEDETIQHAGCSFAPLAEFGGWTFCLHPEKGLAFAGDESPLTVEAVTGACLLMRTDLARSLGGFDEGYAIGDFEDADLCRKVRQKGLTCVVDRRAQLYHLERQSQGGQQSPWRLNLTLFNAWRFQTHWAEDAARSAAQ